MSARILVIEDNPANLDLITYLLQAFGYEVATARDGRSGLAAAGAERPDLILCDIQMPGMDGLQVIAHLRRDPALRGISTIAMTAYAMVGDREKLLAAGFDGYISKPITPETFLDEIAAFVAKPAAAAAAARPAAPRAAAAQPAPRRPLRGTVLLVDDTGANGDLVTTLLEPSGFEVLVAQDTAEGERLALEHRPALILSDVHIGAESGYEFIRRVQAHPALARVPFVFLSSTAWNVAKNLSRAREAGAADFIQRPIEGPEFIERIETALRRAHGDHPDRGRPSA